jgi:hypothetical protein
MLRSASPAISDAASEGCQPSRGDLRPLTAFSKRVDGKKDAWALAAQIRDRQSRLVHGKNMFESDAGVAATARR